MKLQIVVPAEGATPFLEFYDALDEKQRQKLCSLFALILQSPTAVMREPYVKHFSIERYQALYELRAKSKNLVRLIFTITDSGDILFLAPFIKRHKRNTMQALERSLDYLAYIKDGSCSVQELSIKFFLNVGITVREIPVYEGDIPPVEYYVVYRKGAESQGVVPKMLSTLQ